MPINIGQEMALPMEQIIGGPMQALIRAQSLAASETAEFINTVGIEGTGNARKARMVSFNFDRKRALPAGNAEGGAEQTKTETVNLTVPLLTIVPIPFIRIEEATIDFECKVSSSTLDTSKHDVGVNASASGGFWGVKFSVSASYSYQSTHSDQIDKSATLKVHVKAVQDQLPKGLERMLNILESAIVDTPPALAAPANPAPAPAPANPPKPS